MCFLIKVPGKVKPNGDAHMRKIAEDMDMARNGVEAIYLFGSVMSAEAIAQSIIKNNVAHLLRGIHGVPRHQDRPSQ